MKKALILAFGVTVLSAFAGWNGAGVPSGTGSAVINDAANWSGGVIDGNFSGITTEGTTALVLTNAITFAEGTAKAMGVSFASNSTAIVFTSVVGVAVGQTVSGTSIPYNAFLIALTDTTGTLSRATTGLPSGSYTFTRPALNFDFGVAGTRASNVTVSVGSDVPGSTRTLTLNGRLCQSSQAIPTNRVIFSSDVTVACGNPSSVTRESGAVNSGAILPQLLVNGPLSLGNFGTSTTVLTLDGGDLTLKGVVSGTNAKINVAGNGSYVGTLTLTNPNNTFSGGLTSSGGGTLVANASAVFAPSGSNSALGSGGPLGLNNTKFSFTGFTARQVCDRSWNIGGGTGSMIVNNGSAPIDFAGTMRNDVASYSMLLAGSYQNRGTPNLISGYLYNGTTLLGVNVQNGTWRLTNPTNTFTGPVRVGTSSGATLQFTALENAGVKSPLGTGSQLICESAGGGNSAYFEYVGTNNVSCNRSISLAGNSSDTGSGSGLFVNGLGRLELSGGITNILTANNNGLGIRGLYLGGTGTGSISGRFSLGDVISGSNTGRISVYKVGSGTWTLSGSNFNHRGSTVARAGKLNLDYTSYDQITDPNSGTVYTDGGTLRLVAKPAGATSDAFGTFQMGSGATQYRTSRLTLDANGGDGFALTVSSLADDGAAQKFELFDLSSSAGNSVTVNTLGTKMNVVNGTLMNNASSTNDTAARTLIVLRTTDGYGFPVLSGISNGVLQRLSGQAPLPTSVYVNTLNYSINGGDTVSPSADVYFSTLTMDTAAGVPTLALGARKINTNVGGRSILFCGPNNATISGTGTSGHISATSLWFHNYLNSNATFNASFNLAGDSGGPHTLWGGPGFTSYTGTGLGKNFHLAGGVFRMATAQTLTFPSSGGIFVITCDGVFEIGADLNGTAAGDFTFAVGSPGAALTNIAFYGDAGLSAAGANRTVNFGGGGATLTWGSSNFLTFFDGSTDYGYALKLSSAYADAMIEIQNPIDLNGNSLSGRIRTVDVANGSAAIDARLSGALSGNAAFAKKGAGTLELTGAQSYDGPLMVMEGNVRFGAGNIVTNALTVQLRGGGIAAGGGANTFGPLEIYANATLDVGDGTSSLTFANSRAAAWNGTLTITGKLGPATLRLGADETGLTASQLAAIRIGSDKVGLSSSGYLYRIPAGTAFFVR